MILGQHGLTLVALQNHDIKKADAQQTFRLMHYFAVEGKTFPPGFPRVCALPCSPIMPLFLLELRFTPLIAPRTAWCTFILYHDKTLAETIIHASRH